MPGCSKPSPPSTGPAASAPAVGPSACPAKPADPYIQSLLAVLCPQEKAFLQDLKARRVKITAYDKITFYDPYYDGKQWTTEPFPAGGSQQGSNVTMIRTGSPQDDASIIYHEGVHTGQPRDWAPRDKEYEAYTKEDEWRRSRGLSPQDPSFRGADGKTDEKAVKKKVDEWYPGVTAKSPTGGAPETIVGSDPDGKTRIQRADGSEYTRKPKKGDSYMTRDPPVTVPADGKKLDINDLQCP